MKENDVLDLVETIYTAATNPDHWPVFLDRCSDVFTAQGTTLFLYNDNTRQSKVTGVQDLAFVHQVRFDPEYIKQFEEYYSFHNVWLEILKDLPENTPICTDEIYPITELKKTELYNDWLKPQNYLHGLGACVLRQESMTLRFSAFRSASQGTFTHEDLEKFKQLMPHLKRACEIHIKFAENKALVNSSFNNMNLLPFGVVLMNSKGRVLFANQFVENIITQRGGMTIDSEGRILAFNSSETEQMQKLIHKSIETAIGVGTSPGGHMKLTRMRGRSLMLLISPLRADAMNLADLPCALILVTDPDHDTELCTQKIMELYSISLTEAKIVTELIKGLNLNEISVLHQVSLDTVRKQLKSIFKKTHTHSQVELIKLILTGPLALINFN